MSFSSCSVLVLVRLLLNTIPALEKSRSTGAELQGIVKSCNAKLSNGVFFLWVQYFIGFASPASLGWSKNHCNSPASKSVELPSDVLQKSSNFNFLAG